MTTHMATSGECTREEISVLNRIEEALRELSCRFDRLSADVYTINEETRKSLMDIETKIENCLREMKEEHEKRLKDIAMELDNKTKKIETALDEVLSELKKENNKTMPEMGLCEETMDETEIAQEAKDGEISDIFFDALNEEEVKEEEEEVKEEEEEVNREEDGKETNANRVNEEEVKAAEVKAEDVKVTEVNDEEVKTEKMSEEEVKTGQQVKTEDVNGEEEKAENVNGEVVKADDVKVEEVNGEEEEPENVNEEEMVAEKVVRQNLQTKEEVKAEDVNREEVTVDRVNQEEMKDEEVTHEEAMANQININYEGVKAEEIQAEEVKRDETYYEEEVKAGEVDSEEVKAEEVKGEEMTTTSKVETLNRDLQEELGNQMTLPIENETEVMLSTFIEDPDEKTTIITKEEEIGDVKEMTELSNLEQNGFNMERYNRLRSFQQMDSFTLVENKSKFQPDLTWKIDGIRDKMQRLAYEETSRKFEWSGYPVGARMKMLVSLDGNVRLSLHLEERHNREARDVKLIPHIYYVLRGGPKRNLCRSRTYLFTSKFDYSLDFESFLPLQSHLNNAAYRVDDFITVEMYVEPPTMAQLVHSHDGTLHWAIENYGNVRQMAEERSVLYHQSPYFYTGPKGYRVQVRMELDLSLSAHICFLPGEFDIALPESFPHRAVVTLFHRKDNRRNVTKIVEQNIGIDKGYFVHLCIGEELKNFVINDTLFYKVTIKPLN